MDFVSSTLKVSLRVVDQFNLYIVQCAVLSALVPTMVFLAAPVVFVRVCEVYEYGHLNREYLLWFFLCSIVRWAVLQRVCGLAKAGRHNRVEARLMLRPQRA